MNIEPNENQKRWQTIIESQIASGQPQVKWCEEHDVNIHNFRYWKRRLKEDQEAPISSTGFVAITPKTSSKPSKLRITIGKAAIEINEEVDPIFLRSIVQVLSDHV